MATPAPHVAEPGHRAGHPLHRARHLRAPDSRVLHDNTWLSGAEVTSPMVGVTDTMAWLSHVPSCSRAGLYGPASIDFRFVSELRLQRALAGACVAPSLVLTRAGRHGISRERENTEVPRIRAEWDHTAL